MKKHVIIAGAARSGKTTLSLKLGQKGYTHYKMDSIKRGICDIFNLDQHNWKKLSPMIARLMNVMIKENETDTGYEFEKYVLDTPHLFPKDVHFIDTSSTIVIFLGYAYIDPNEQLLMMKKYDKDNYWTKEYSDEQLLGMIKANIEFSKYLEEECRKLNILYFDTSYHRDEVLCEIENLIISQKI